MTSTSATPSTSTATSTAASSDYDVFINHRGPDVKETFASDLYHRLLPHGIRVFLDKPEMKPGEYITAQIEGAIRSATVHVAIFSRGYADSRWCLNELVLMLESKTPIIPVFYDVEPADLRWKRGTKRSYAEAFDEHKLRYDPPTIEKWTNALSQVAGISGIVHDGNSDEGELLRKVVEEVLRRVKTPALPFEVAKYPIGLDNKIEDIENTVLEQLQHSKKLPILGIVGLGGVGKTTLAQELFNRKNSNYTKSCFLSNVRENKGRLVSLQKKLLKCLNAPNDEIEEVDDVSQGIGLLRTYLSSVRALVVIDDADDGDQVDALLPHETVLHSDSLVVITSRNKDVLRSAGVEESSIYNLTGLTTQHSFELFCLHSFNRPHPPLEFESLVDKFVEACAGLPLSLKVVGALLKGKGLVYWEDQLKKFKRMLPQRIKQTLQISYDALDEEEKTIFLDIACFFIGEDRDMVISIWDGGVCGFQNLQSKCLVEVDDQNTIKMHDQLRDLGRDIAKASTPRRLWRLQQSSVINDQVRGISIDGSSEMPVHGTAISLKNLQIVHTRKNSNGDLLERILRRSDFSNLLWLRWDNCPYSSLPSWISMKNLRVLQVQGTKLETLWENESQVPVRLRELKIILRFFTGQLNIPKSIGQLKNLERIVISHEESLYGSSWFVQPTKLPEEFCLLESLKALVLIGCSEMKSLPERFGNLTNLQHIDLRACRKLERLPDSFGQLVKLQYLNLEKCWDLTMSSETLGNIRTLEYMNLSECNKIEVFPPQVAHQSSLQQLRFRSTALNIKELPSTIGELGYLEVLEIGGPLLEMLPPVCSLKNLKELGLYACNQLKCLPDSLGDLRSLMKLAIYNCKELKYLPASIGQLTQLTELSIRSCRLIEELPFIKEVKGERETSSDLESSSDNCILPRLQKLSVFETGISEVSFAQGVCFNLRDLSMSYCDNLIKVGSLPNSLIEVDFKSCQNLRKIEICGLAKLQSLILDGCGELEELAHIETLVSLENLNISGCSELEDLEGIQHCVSLYSLNVSGCVKLKSIRGLGQLAEDISGCSELEDLEGIQHCVSLYSLKASGCVKLKSIRGLGQLANLEDLDISGCSELEEVDGIQHCLSLYTLKASGCVKLKNIRGLGQLANLENLDISGCSELEEVDGIQHCLSLYSLKASGCVKLKSIRGLGQLANLEDLDISGCSELEEVDGIQHCLSLDTLEASGCVKLKSIRGLGQLAKLKDLDISGCSELKDLEGIQHCVSLYSLNASGCVKLKSIWGLGQLADLEDLDISGCSELEEVDGIQHWSSLDTLEASGCVKLKSIRGLSQLAKLKDLDISGCSELEDLEGIEHCLSLYSLKASGCVKLKSIRGLGQLAKLTCVYINGCSELEEVEGIQHCVSLSILDKTECPKLQLSAGVVEHLRQQRVFLLT